MTRDGLKDHFAGMSKGFRFRGIAQSRIETFSDAVFALAVTLLLISSNPPRTFDQLIIFSMELLPFAFCITLIGVIWFQHFMFFFRYGLMNAPIVFLNLILLFTVLFYVYPLKFLTTMLSLFIMAVFFGMTTERADHLGTMIHWSDVSLLMVIYGLGVITIFLVLALMYRYASKKSVELELNELERFDTRSGIYSNLLMASVPVLSVVVALLFSGNQMAGLYSGMVYNLYWPVMFIYGHKRRKKRNSLLFPAAEDNFQPELEESTVDEQDIEENDK